MESPTVEVESIQKYGWVGALDKADTNTKLDVNDGVQDVRIRISQGLNDAGVLSSKSWNPEDFLNWANNFHTSKQVGSIERGHEGTLKRIWTSNSELNLKRSTIYSG